MGWYYGFSFIWQMWSKNKIFSGWKHMTDTTNLKQIVVIMIKKITGNSLEETCFFHTQSCIFWISGCFFYWMWNFVVAHASNLDPQLIHSPVKWLISSVILFHKLWYCNWLYCEPAGFIGTFIIIHQSYELNDESNGSTLPFHPTISEPYKQLPTVPPPLYTQTAAYAFM